MNLGTVLANSWFTSLMAKLLNSVSLKKGKKEIIWQVLAVNNKN